MITYTIVLMVIYLIVIGYGLGSISASPEYSVGSFLIMLPVFGRVLGWW